MEVKEVEVRGEGRVHTFTCSMTHGLSHSLSPSLASEGRGFDPRCSTTFFFHYLFLHHLTKDLGLLHFGFNIIECATIQSERRRLVLAHTPFKQIK